MSQAIAATPAKLVIGAFMKDKALFLELAEILEKKFGPIDMVCPWLPFDFTDYYSKEMGGPLFRRVISFVNLIAQDSLSEIKAITNKIESGFLNNNNRGINIDPGYLVHERFVLATGKNFTHRIYVGNGTYADLTLVFSKGSFQDLAWTYPDYKSKLLKNFLALVRKKYVTDIKRLNSDDKKHDRLCRLRNTR
ncbi:MAG: DUF4416 family protein [Deltaproteobacteria bacterium]|nr:DUF4416 family protein [Deltaproteobacteria bacterium]